jgi:hypothetical protein
MLEIDNSAAERGFQVFINRSEASDCVVELQPGASVAEATRRTVGMCITCLSGGELMSAAN